MGIRKMKKTCQAKGVLSPPSGQKNMTLEMPGDSTIRDVLEKCGYRPSTFRIMIFIVNGKRQKLYHQLSDGDNLDIFLPVGGG